METHPVRPQAALVGLALSILSAIALTVLTPGAAAAARPKAPGLGFDPWRAKVSVKTYPDVRVERPDFNSKGNEIVADLRAASASGGGIETHGGTDHVYVTKFNPRTGRPGASTCLTCDQPGPNGYAKWSPDDKKILFSSGRLRNPDGKKAGGGAPGDDLWVMNADGSGQTQLTFNTGTDADSPTDFHAVWSTSGRQISWIHHECRFECPWQTMIAGYREKPAPHLVNVRQLEPDDTSFHETQDFTPDGLLMETITAEGFLNGESFLVDPRTGERVKRLTHNPYWDEQFHPSSDGRYFVQMSSRDNPGDAQSTQSDAYWRGDPPTNDFRNAELFAPSFNQPNGPKTDLYLIDRNRGDSEIRRLTRLGDDNQVIPEFDWSPNDRFLAWGGKIAHGLGKGEFIGLQVLTFGRPCEPGAKRRQPRRCRKRPNRCHKQVKRCRKAQRKGHCGKRAKRCRRRH